MTEEKEGQYGSMMMTGGVWVIHGEYVLNSEVKKRRNLGHCPVWRCLDRCHEYTRILFLVYVHPLSFNFYNWVNELINKHITK